MSMVWRSVEIIAKMNVVFSGKRAEQKEVVRNHPSRQGRASAREEARRRRSKKCGRKIVVGVRRWITYGSFSHLCSSQKVPGQVKVYTK